jgi:peptidoglycan DL-endopeptidase CwlO
VDLPISRVETCTFLHEEALSSSGTVVRSRSVLGQAHTPRRRLWPLAAIALAVLVAPAVGGANPSHSARSLRARDAAIAAQSRSAVLGLYALDQRLFSARSRLASLHVRSQSLRAERVAIEQQLRVARRSIAVTQRALAQRVRTLYEQGDVGSIDVLLGARSLDEAMNNIDALSRISDQGKRMLVDLRAAKARLVDASRQLATREAALAAAERAAQATAASLAAARDRRSAYIASLAHQQRVTRHELSLVVERAHAAQVRSAAIARAATATTHVAPAVALAAGRTITVSATGYSLGGRTSTGLPVGWGVAAVDPSVIPLGSHLTVPGYGEAVAADTGGAVAGATIDLWFPTIAQANAWGRRTVTIVVH